MSTTETKAEKKPRGPRFGGPEPSRMTHLRAWLAGTGYRHEIIEQRQGLARQLGISTWRLHKIWLGSERPGITTALVIKKMSGGKLTLDKLQDPELFLIAPQAQTNAVKSRNANLPP